MLGIACSGYAGEQAKHVIAIDVVGEDDTEKVSLKLNSEDLGFELDEMQVGETRSVVDEKGRAILITRSESGFSFDVNGKTIDMPDFTEVNGENFHWVANSDDAAMNVQVLHHNRTATLAGPGGTVIITSKPIDESTRLSIQAILESAGHGSEVDFIDHENSDDGQVFIKKVEKVVDTS